MRQDEPAAAILGARQSLQGLTGDRPDESVILDQRAVNRELEEMHVRAASRSQLLHIA